MPGLIRYMAKASFCLNERRCIARDVQGVYGNLILYATYRIDCALEDVALRGQIDKALRQCIVEHPVLGVVIQDVETEKPQLYRPSSLLLDEHVRYLETIDTREDDAGTVQALLKQVHNEPFAQWHVRPAWRVHILPTTPNGTSQATELHVAFAYSHALADGFSGVLFHQTLLRALNTQHSPTPTNESVFQISAEDHHLLPPLEKAATLPISWSFLLRPLFGEFLPAWIVRALGMSSEIPDGVWTGAQKRPPSPTSIQPIRTAVCCRRIPPAHLERALAACRGHGVRLTGLLAVMVARALARALRARGQVRSDFIANLPLDLRRCIPQASHSMANYASGTTETIHILSKQHQDHDLTSPESLTDEDWATARRLTERLSEASNTLADQPVALLKYLSDFRDWTTRQIAKPADSSFELSNVGSFNAASFNPSQPHRTAEGDWSLRDIVFSQSANALGAPFNVNVASTKGGPLAIVLTWWPGMLGVEDEESLMDDVADGLVDQMAHV
ncbi:Alcohol acetyltransferase [Friedmanniomyces endolithicus]|uniref:Alcohol acetyltransferase n=1 Tax=Friedmanniomyces endolithicus TaxID=329885 RepID=A0AAN6KEH9_9PEZI|nr:Alcohol acetyltransferase [Friedmanniomyces endolithicus]KAK0780939.1 Alcohol acetyltransferase [Friedmanniomyces endolithicus]KAK0789404.1 Alcohol acetyltransferase [Friedmanniomyces endolithicus]KAK0799365.1 Alcohol acetyltransferase [Friedmanniomyces endolithicus]KAK0842561.1 Alcohol acetyltransferase [Friedmanniomyces endolithicus]